MASSSSDRTYRVLGLPLKASRLESEKILSDLFDKDGQKTTPKVHSLGFDPHESRSSLTQVATATFRYTPAVLEKGDDWNFDIDDTTTITIDTNFLGFTPLSSEKDSTIDFIAVSGLSSHPFGSWKARGGQYMWLRDRLAKDYQARVLLYGYDSGLVKSESFQDILDIAKQLCNHIDSIRRPKLGQTNFEPRPIVFIAHSLGGLVVKEAIYQMASSYPDDYLSIYGLLLFGVPNQGINISHWLPIVNDQPNEELIQNLKPGATYLRALQEKFCSVFRYHGSRVVSIYETKKSKTAKQDSLGHWAVTGETEILVLPESAQGSYPSEISHTRVPFNQNHADLPKFPGPRHKDYRIVQNIFDEFDQDAVRVIQERFAKEATILHSRENLRSERYSLMCQKCNQNFGSRITLFKHLNDVEKKECYQAALYHAIVNGHSGVAEVLLSQRANLDKMDKDTEVALHWAAQCGQLKMVKLLLGRKANIEAKGVNGYTPLQIAVWYGQIEEAKLLLDRGANIELRTDNGHTPLHIAVWHGQLRMVELLLNRKADIRAKAKNGYTPLHLAAWYGKVKVAELLLGRGASIKARRDNGNTPLRDAEYRGHSELVRLLRKA